MPTPRAATLLTLALLLLTACAPPSDATAPASNAAPAVPGAPGSPPQTGGRY